MHDPVCNIFQALHKGSRAIKTGGGGLRAGHSGKKNFFSDGYLARG